VRKGFGACRERKKVLQKDLRAEVVVSGKGGRNLWSYGRPGVNVVRGPTKSEN